MATTLHIGANLNFTKYVYGRKRALEIARDELGLRCVEMVPDSDYGAALFAKNPDKFRAYHREVGEYGRKIGVEIASVLTFYRDNVSVAHPDPAIREVAMLVMESMAVQAGEYGAKYVGASLGTVLAEDFANERVRAKLFNAAAEAWKKWMEMAHREGLRGVNIESMSTLREPPATIRSARKWLSELNDYHRRKPDTTVPCHLCYDLGHGPTEAEDDSPADRDFASWFEAFGDAIVEVHIKNTDSGFISTWPFTDEYKEFGIIDLDRVAEAMRDHLRAPEVYVMVEVPGKRGRMDGEADALRANHTTIENLKKSLKRAGWRENANDGTWSLPDAT